MRGEASTRPADQLISGMGIVWVFTFHGAQELYADRNLASLGAGALWYVVGTGRAPAQGRKGRIRQCRAPRAGQPVTEQTIQLDLAATVALAPIAGGCYIKGRPESEPEREVQEGPQHEVRLPAFVVAEYEVTFDEGAPAWLTVAVPVDRMTGGVVAENGRRSMCLGTICRPVFAGSTDMQERAIGSLGRG